MRRERVRETLCGSVLSDCGLFDMATVAKLLDQHKSGERDQSAALWSLSMFEAFLRQVHGCRVYAKAPPDPVASVV